jgi:DNA-binding MarR family transcriptional regulator
MKPSEISQMYCISKPNVTTLISKLIADGFAQRYHDEKDRRVVYVTITDKGNKAVMRHRKIIKEYLLKVLNQLDEDEIRDIYEGMEKIQNIMNKINKLI